MEQCIFCSILLSAKIFIDREIAWLEFVDTFSRYWIEKKTTTTQSFFMKQYVFEHTWLNSPVLAVVRQWDNCQKPKNWKKKKDWFHLKGEKGEIQKKIGDLLVLGLVEYWIVKKTTTTQNFSMKRCFWTYESQFSFSVFNRYMYIIVYVHFGAILNSG